MDSTIQYHHGIITGLIVGVALWALLFVPVSTFGIQTRLNSTRSPIRRRINTSMRSRVTSNRYTPLLLVAHWYSTLSTVRYWDLWLDE